MSDKPRRGRPRPTPPPGYLTIKEAADEADASYSTVYRMIQADQVEWKRQGSTWFVLAADVEKIRGALEATGEQSDDRKAVMLRPNRERYDRWEKAAGPNKRVSTWVAELADEASAKAEKRRATK